MLAAAQPAFANNGVHHAGVWHVCGFIDEDGGGLDTGSKGEVVARSM